MSDYTTLAALRAADGLDDQTFYPDATLTDAITYAEELIDRYTGTSFVYKAFSETLDGTNSHTALLHRTLFPRTISSATVDGVAQTTTGWVLKADGRVIRNDGYFGYVFPGDNVVISGTAGFSVAPPQDIKWAALTIARQYALDLTSRVPDRATQVANDFGTVTLAQAGGYWRPTNLPDVNAVLNRHRHRGPGYGGYS